MTQDTIHPGQIFKARLPVLRNKHISKTERHVFRTALDDEIFPVPPFSGLVGYPFWDWQSTLFGTGRMPFLGLAEYPFRDWQDALEL